MKVIPFQIPRSAQESFRIQIDEVPHFYNHLHQHPEIQVTLIQKGTGILVAGNYVGRFAPTDVFVIGSNQPHVFRSDDIYFKDSPGCLSTSVFFDANTLGADFWKMKEVNTFRSFFADSSGGYKLGGDAAELAMAALEELPGCRGLDKIIQFLKLVKGLGMKTDLQPLASHTGGRSLEGVTAQRMKNIMEFTFNESHRLITLKEVSDIAHLTPEAFCKYFKMHTRKTYINFLNEIRVNHACRLLMESADETINNICYQCGFNNLANFNRVFKKVTGLSPRDYRRL
jgi:AraC-like DNA-binding protein